MKIVNGWAFPLADGFMSSRIGVNGEYQKSHLDAALKLVRGWKVAVDGGAHVGTWSKLMVQRFSSVVSFEPSVDTFECLVHNMQGITNASLRNQALGKAPGMVEMTLEGFERAIMLKNTGARFTKEGGTTERVTLDSLELPALDFLKLDVEGGEVDALEGARRTLKEFHPVVLFEDKNLWKRYGYGRQAPHDLLTYLGARHLIRVQMDEIWGW